MVLKNYYKALSAWTNCTIPAVSLTGTNQNITWSNTNYSSDNYFNILNSFGFYGLVNPAATSYTANRVVFGNGTVEPTLDDYCLSGDVITNIATTVNSTAQLIDNGVERTSVFTITNNNSSSITISEVGYCGSINPSSGSAKILFERTLLESPITIPPGGVGQVTYTIRMNYPVAEE